MSTLRVVFPEADTEEEAKELLDDLIDNLTDGTEKNEFGIIYRDGLFDIERLKRMRDSIKQDREESAKALEMDG